MSPRPSAPLVVGVALALAAAGGAAWWFAGHRRAGPAPAPMLFAAPVAVEPGLHLLGNTLPNAAYVIDTSDGLVLVDTCKEADAGPVLEQMAARGLDPRRLRYILLTHCHADHVLGARRLREISGAKVCAGAGDAAVIRDGAPREAMTSVFHMPMAMHGTPVDVEFAGGETIDLGGVRITAIAAPGHSPGSICYLAERAGRRWLFTGDVIASFTDASPLVRQGLYTAFLGPRYRGDAVAYFHTLGQLAALPPPDLMLPGHLRDDPLPRTAAIGADAWRALLADRKALLQSRLDRYARDGRDFLDGRARQFLPGLVYLGEIDGSSVHALVTVEGRVHLIDAPGGDALPAFVEAGLRKAGVAAQPPNSVLLTTTEDAAISGLAAIVKASNAVVFAPASGLSRVEELCPPGTTVRDAAKLPDAGWFPVEVVPLAGRGRDAVAYMVKWNDRLLAFSGRTPLMMSPETDDDLMSAIGGANGSRDAYLASLTRLESFAPDLWLPGRAAREQAANLYEFDWKNALELNRVRLAQ